jgi:hypothetical protein
MITAPFFIEANKSRIVTAVETEFERAFEDQAARESLNVGQRQSVMRRAAQFIKRVHDIYYSAQVPRIN